MISSDMKNSVADYAAAVTPHDSNANDYDYLYVGVGGDVKVTTRYGNVVTFVGVLGGSYLWIRTSLIWSTGTTATSIVGHK